jgi:hypothetical protein
MAHAGERDLSAIFLTRSQESRDEVFVPFRVERVELSGHESGSVRGHFLFLIPYSGFWALRRISDRSSHEHTRPKSFSKVHLFQPALLSGGPFGRPFGTDWL